MRHFEKDAKVESMQRKATHTKDLDNANDSMTD